MVTVVPILDVDGQLIWVEKRTLGDVASGLMTAKAALSVASNIQNQTGVQPTNETLNDISKVAGTVAGIAAVIPGGQIVAVVAGVVAIAAQVLSGVFGGGPTTAQQVQALKSSNDDLRDQVNTMDNQIAKVNDAMKSFYSVLQQNGFNTSGLQGLGDFLSDFQNLITQQEANASLQMILAQKGQQLQSLLQTYTTVVQQVSSAVNTKSTGQKYVLWGLIGLAAIGIGIYSIRELENKEDK